MAKKVVNGSVVRAWATSPEGQAILSAEGLTVGKRGRFDSKLITAFQKATGQKYGVGHVEPRKVSGVRVNAETGRKTPVTVKATLPEIRVWAQAQPGLNVGSKGRIADSVLSAFAARPKA